MKGLVFIPATKDFELAYEKLQFDAIHVRIGDLSLWSQWTRFDARLGELLVFFFFKNWKNLSPVFLNEEILKQPWPAVMGVLLEQTKILIKLKKLNSTQFQNWKKCVLLNVHPAQYEQYFIGLNSISSKRVHKDVCFPLLCFEKWGYLSTELMISKPPRNLNITLHSKKIRSYILKALFDEKNKVRVTDYRQALENRIHKKQAERDLSEFAQARGKTKSRVYLSKNL